MKEINEVIRKMITKCCLPECIRENKDNVIFKFDDIDLENKMKKDITVKMEM